MPCNAGDGHVPAGRGAPCDRFGGDLSYSSVQGGRSRSQRLPSAPKYRGTTMAWTTPTLVEICIGLEINGYLPAEF
jgi:coenzyme PQQ precursor peptide PqqA